MASNLFSFSPNFHLSVLNTAGQENFGAMLEQFLLVYAVNDLGSALTGGRMEEFESAPGDPILMLYLWCPWCKRSVQRSQFNVDESLHELVLAIRFHELESPPAPAIHPKKKEHKSCSCSIL
ncbi:hypothetical protein Chor_012643 [Crotalus horridus]